MNDKLTLKQLCALRTSIESHKRSLSEYEIKSLIDTAIDGIISKGRLVADINLTLHNDKLNADEKLDIVQRWISLTRDRSVKEYGLDFLSKSVENYTSQEERVHEERISTSSVNVA